mgnify:CR=1 FL=1
MAAAVPFALKAGTAIGGSLLGRKLSGPSKQQKTAMQGTQQGAQAISAAGAPLVKTGTDLIREGRGYTGQGAESLAPAASYYRNVLGSRSAANAALAPERATALDYYGGAQRKAQRTLRGPQRDTAVAELDRQQAGQLASYLPQARRAGAGRAAA